MSLDVNIADSPLLKSIYDQGADYAAGYFLNSVELILNRRGIFLDERQRNRVAFFSMEDIGKLNDLAHGASYDDIQKFVTPIERPTFKKSFRDVTKRSPSLREEIAPTDQERTDDSDSVDFDSIIWGGDDVGETPVRDHFERLLDDEDLPEARKDS